MPLYYLQLLPARGSRRYCVQIATPLSVTTQSHYALQLGEFPLPVEYTLSPHTTESWDLNVVSHQGVWLDLKAFCRCGAYLAALLSLASLEFVIDKPIQFSQISAAR